MYDFKTTKLPILKPLKNSFANGTIESEYRDLFLEVFSELLAERYFDVSVLGSAQLGSLNLVRKAINNDGLVMLEGDTEEVNTRRIYRAWMSRNNQGRGLHFLRAYLQLVFPNVCAVDQLWQKKTLAYPLFAICKRSDPQIDINTEDYFLTSRIEISLDPNVDSKNVQKIGAIVRSIIPARLVPSFRFYIVFDFSIEIWAEWITTLSKRMAANYSWTSLFIEPKVQDAWFLGIDNQADEAPKLYDSRFEFTQSLEKVLEAREFWKNYYIEPQVKDAWCLSDENDYKDGVFLSESHYAEFIETLSRRISSEKINCFYSESTSFNKNLRSEIKPLAEIETINEIRLEQKVRLETLYIEPLVEDAWLLGNNEQPNLAKELYSVVDIDLVQ